MFKGQAKLEISHATLVIAVQEYFSRRAAPWYMPTVDNVKVGNYNSNNAAPTFVIEMTEPPPSAAVDAKPEG